MKPTDYHYPHGWMIGRGDETERLYDMEHRRGLAINTAAQELAKVLDHDPREFYTRTMPEALLAVLDSSDHQAGVLAAIAHIERELRKSLRLDINDNVSEWRRRIREHLLPLLGQ